jgi:hypothetical protein
LGVAAAECLRCLLMPGMSTLASAAALIVAVSDYAAVHSIIQAIRTADAETAAMAGPAGATGAACDGVAAARFEQTPPADIEPRRVYHPEPRYLPRPVIHPRPRVELGHVLHAAICPQGVPCQQSTLFPPPWRQVPWVLKPNGGVIVRTIKVPAAVPDTGHVGLTLDTFL